MANFKDNNYKLAFTKLSLFCTITRFYPYISFDIIKFSDTSICKKIFKQKTLNIFKNMETNGNL